MTSEHLDKPALTLIFILAYEISVVIVYTIVLHANINKNKIKFKKLNSKYFGNQISQFVPLFSFILWLSH